MVKWFFKFQITCHVLILTPFVVPENLAPFIVTPETKSLDFPDPKLPMLISLLLQTQSHLKIIIAMCEQVSTILKVLFISSQLRYTEDCDDYVVEGT